jgi:hypothetical protein
MCEEAFRAALVKIACLWDATGDPVSNQAAGIAREVLIACSEPISPRPTLAPSTALPDYDA